METDPSRFSVPFVDDEPQILSMLKRILAEEDYISIPLNS
jgi:hypothetical protein